MATLSVQPPAASLVVSGSSAKLTRLVYPARTSFLVSGAVSTFAYTQTVQPASRSLGLSGATVKLVIGRWVPRTALLVIAGGTPRITNKLTPVAQALHISGAPVTLFTGKIPIILSARWSRVARQIVR